MARECVCVCVCYSGLLVTGKKAREREKKWLAMLDNWDEWMTKRRPKVSVSFTRLPGRSQ